MHLPFDRFDERFPPLLLFLQFEGGKMACRMTGLTSTLLLVRPSLGNSMISFTSIVANGTVSNVPSFMIISRDTKSAAHHARQQTPIFARIVTMSW